MVIFWDEVEVSLQAGKGGNGCVSFRREKFVPKGGPDGGDGGRGGHIILRADSSENTLMHFARTREFHARDGGPGRGKNQHGADAQDLVLRVPVGTLVKDAAKGNTLKDLSTPGDEVIIATGGRGGRGNQCFANSVRQTPRFAEDGKPGEAREIKLELKLVADVGLLGLPNAGKSTLLSRLSKARPKVDSYPFTTVIPELGVVDLGEGQGFVMVDIPGLIEGAHSGSGLGDAFLRHVERTRVLVHLVDCSSTADTAPEDAVGIIERELEQYSAGLAGKPRILVATKLDDPAARDRARELAQARGGARVLAISAVTGEGLGDLLQAIQAELARQKPGSTQA